MPFADHVTEMVKQGVIPTLDKYKYRCTNKSDKQLVTGWMEIVVILFKTVKEAGRRQEIMDYLYQPYVGSIKFYDSGLEIDKNAGTVTVNGTVHRFTPVFQLTAGY